MTGPEIGTPEKIEPVLSRDEWRRVEKDEVRVTLEFPAEGDLPDERIMLTTEWAPDLIALANHGLPDADPRKITRAWLDLLHRAADAAMANDGDAKALRQVAEALESYLPPEG